MAHAIPRLSSNDLTVLATDAGQVPMNIAATLLFEPVDDPASLVRTLTDRLARIPRLRQRLLRPGLRGGRPLWVTDSTFDVARHVDTSSLPASALACQRLPSDRPLWRMVVDVQGQRVRVVIVLHHVLADGMGGLAALASLVDGVRAPDSTGVAEPSRRALVRDAARTRRRGLQRLPASLRALAAGAREMGLGGQRPSLVPRSSILRPTSNNREMRVVEVGLSEVVRGAHARGATVNDLVLCAVAGAVERLLAGRGERPPQIVISVPVAGSRDRTDLGNQVGAVPIAVPVGLTRDERLSHIVTSTTRAKSEQRGSSAQVLSVLFRGLAAVHAGQFFVNHQRLVHTFETNLRGPVTPLVIDGQPVRSIVPLALNPGNVSVSFDVLSYAGRVVITVVTCPRTVPEADAVAGFLRSELAAVMG